MTTNNPLVSVDYSKTIFNPRWFIENMLYIVDKNGKLIKFKLNYEQDVMLQHIEICLDNDLPIRIIILKARQIGATTFFTALGFWFATMSQNTTYAIVAHRDDSAQSIFEKNKVFYNNLPKELQPSTTQFSSDGITYNKKNGKGINSKIKFATVSDDVYRGQTINYLHQSERAFFNGDIIAIDNALNNTVSASARTIIVKESTANGYNFFKDEWDRAVKGKSNYTPFFFGWQDHKEYRMTPPRDFVLTDEEQLLKDKFSITDEQIMWRRWKIDNDYNGNPEWFLQEYPMTPEEAFVASGSSVFDSSTILEGYNNCCEPEKYTLTSYPTFEKLYIWETPQFNQENIYQKKSEWDYDKQEYVLVDTDLLIEQVTYKTPYTVGVDTSGMGADYNQVVVVNNITKQVVARYGKKNISEENLAKIVVEIAILYNNALIAPEVNYSHSICEHILKLNYKNIYVTENLARQDSKIMGGIEYGFKTTTLTKPAIISNMRSLLNSNPTLIKDKEFWYEAEYFVIEDVQKNIMNASSGHHDDIIIATAIAMYVSNSFQSKQTRIQVKEKNDEHFMSSIINPKHKKTTMRKGIYRNNA